MKWFAISLIFVASTTANEDAVDFKTANNLFAATTYKEVVKSSKDNFLVSPFSAEIILSLALSGSRGKTAEELRHALHLPDDKSKIENDIKTVLPQIKGDEHYALHTANKMYIQKNFPIHEEFKKIATEVYHAQSENIDFTKNIEAAETMNQWVEEQTNNKIKNLIDSNNLNNDSRLVLLNALYLKSDWQTPFKLVNTGKSKFYKSSGDAVEVDTLHQYPVPAFRNKFKYYECPHLNSKFLELPFKGADASMTFILPNEKEGLSALESQIDQAFTPHNLTSEFVVVSIPKFRIETEIDFTNILKNLGVSKAFDEHLADLSGIAGQPGELLIDSVVQKTFIDLSENGVEAAAATRVLVRVPMSGLGKPPKEFIADHPFIFYIKIKDIIVFAGRVTDPSK